MGLKLICLPAAGSKSAKYIDDDYYDMVKRYDEVIKELTEAGNTEETYVMTKCEKTI